MDGGVVFTIILDSRGVQVPCCSLGFLAQLVERLPYTQNVVSSNLAEPTIVKCITGYFCYSWSL